MATRDPIVYLAGPIANTAPGQAVDWRHEAWLQFHDRGVEALSPMRAKEALAKEAIGSNFHAYERRGTFFTSKAIMARDSTDVRRCDVILMNLLGAKSASLGTIMELAWGFILPKPVVVAIEPEGNPHDNHPMIHEAMSFRVETLDEAIDACCVIVGR